MEYQLKYAHLAPDTWNELAEIPRTGWVMRQVGGPENVQQHTFDLLRLAQEIPGFETARADGLCEILEVHDWPEALIGDEVILVWDDEAKKRKLKAEKHQREEAAMRTICAALPEKGEEVFSLWERYEAGVDPTARIAKQIDKYQAIEKALEYELAQGIPLFKEFRDYLLDTLEHPSLLAELKQLENRAAAANIVF